MLKNFIILMSLLMVLLITASCMNQEPKTAEDWNSKGTALRREATSFLQQGKEQEATKCYEEAIKCYDEALKVDPNYTRAKTNKAEVLKALGRE